AALRVPTFVGPHTSRVEAIPSANGVAEYGDRSWRPIGAHLKSRPHIFLDPWRDEAGPGQLLHRRRRRYRPRAAGAPVHAPSLPRRRGRREDLPEAAAEGRSRLGRDRGGELSFRP